MTRLTQATLVIVICALVGSRPTAAANLGIRFPSLTGDRGDSGGSEQPTIAGVKVPNWLSGGRQGNGGSPSSGSGATPAGWLDIIIPPRSPRQQQELVAGLGEANKQLAALRRDLEGKYFELHRETLGRVNGLFAPAVETYRFSLARIMQDLPEPIVARMRMGELIQANLPTTSANSSGVAAEEISRIAMDEHGRLSKAFDELVKVESYELSGRQTEAYIHACEVFGLNMRSVHSEWRTFGPAADQLFKAADAKKLEINRAFERSWLQVTSFLAVNISLDSLLHSGGDNLEERLLAALGASASGQAVETIKVWNENRRFWKGLDAVQTQFDGAFRSIGTSLQTAEARSSENQARIKQIADTTDVARVRAAAERAYANLTRPIDDSTLTVMPKN